MRIAVGSFCHETNSFGNTRVTKSFLQEHTREKEILEQSYRGSHTYLGGFFDEAEALGVQAVPVYATSLKPSGPCDREAFEEARDRLVSLFAEEYRRAPYDGIALFLHGACAAVGHPDVEGELLALLRQKLGRILPIGVVMDLHGNLSQEMIALCDIAMGCKCYPHIDEYDQGRNLFRLLADKIEKGYPTYCSLVKLPWHMVPAQGVTLSGPAQDVQRLCVQHENEDPELLQASFFQGFPYSDVPDCGVSFLTVAKTQACADRHAKALAAYAWSRRQDFAVPLYSAEEAVALAERTLKEKGGPVLIHESSDNPGGGTPGDGTYLLRQLLRANRPSAYGFIFDPQVAELAKKAGVGSRICCDLGGKTDRFHGEPIHLTDAYVKSVSDGSFIRNSPMCRGNRDSLGTTACLVVGNVQIVVASVRNQTFDNGPFVAGCVDWQTMELLALKSAQHFKGWWQDQVRAIIPCESPGLQTANLKLLTFSGADPAYYPLGNPTWK